MLKAAGLEGEVWGARLEGGVKEGRGFLVEAKGEGFGGKVVEFGLNDEGLAGEVKEAGLGFTGCVKETEVGLGSTVLQESKPGTPGSPGTSCCERARYESLASSETFFGA